jgi:hypothetical protein
MTYIASRRVREEGGYEGGYAMKGNLFPVRWNPEVEEGLVRTVHELRDTLDRTPSDPRPNPPGSRVTPPSPGSTDPPAT